MKQLKLTFQLENKVLPLEMERTIVSFFKKAISNYSEDMLQRLYSKEYSIMKTYTFSKYLPNAKFTKNGIELSQDRFILFFTDSNFVQLIEFYNAFLTMKKEKYPLFQNSMTLINIALQNKNDVCDDEIVVKMQSPLIARRHNAETNKDRYYCCYENEFAEVVKENVAFFMKEVDPSLSVDDFYIEVVKGKKVVTTSFGVKIDGNLGIYKIKGSKELLQLLYQSGIGSRRSAGNGKFELL